MSGCRTRAAGAFTLQPKITRAAPDLHGCHAFVSRVFCQLHTGLRDLNGPGHMLPKNRRWRFQTSCRIARQEPTAQAEPAEPEVPRRARQRQRRQWAPFHNPSVTLAQSLLSPSAPLLRPLRTRNRAHLALFRDASLRRERVCAAACASFRDAGKLSDLGSASGSVRCVCCRRSLRRV